MFFPSTVFHSVQFGGQFALRMRCILAVYHNLGYVALNFKCAYQCDGLQALGYVAQETARLDQSKHLATWSWFGAIHLAGVHFPVPGATEYQQSVWTSETARAWKLAGASSRLFLVWNAESFRHAHCFFRSPCSTSWQDLVLTWHPDKQQGPEGRFAAEVGVSMCQPVFFSVHALFQVFRQLMARKTEFLQAVWAAIGSNILLFWFAAGGRSDTVQETKRCHPAEYRTCSNRWNKMHLCPLVQQFALSWFNLRGACKDDGATVCNDIILVFGYIGSCGNVDWPVVPQWVFSIPELQCFSTFSSSWTYTYIYIFYIHIYIYVYMSTHTHTHVSRCAPNRQEFEVNKKADKVQQRQQVEKLDKPHVAW